MTVKQLLRSLDSREISEWIAFFNLREKQPDNQLANTERIKTFFAAKKGPADRLTGRPKGTDGPESECNPSGPFASLNE
jgi:hypothetical protein